MSESRGLALRTRLAAWAAGSTLLTLLVFAGTMYLALYLEIYGHADAFSRAHAQADIRQDGAQLLWSMGWSAPFALAVAVGGALWLARRALAPLEAVIQAAREITAADLHRRLALPATRDELANLVQALNGLLARLEEGFAALARYAADASHELRTPIAVLAADLEIALRRSREPGEWEALAQRALAELQRLASLVEALLQLAKAGQLESRSTLDLREQVDLVLTALARRASDSEHQLSAASEGGSEPVWILGSAEGIGSALRNLLENALRHTPRGCEIRVAVRAAQKVVIVDVEDSGPGVPASERENIFVPFRRVHGNLRADQHVHSVAQIGVGLGLAIVRRVVEAHAGRIRVDDSPLGGARFRIELPRAAPPAVPG